MSSPSVLSSCHLAGCGDIRRLLDFGHLVFKPSNPHHFGQEAVQDEQDDCTPNDSINKEIDLLIHNPSGSLAVDFPE
ncbi:uncharacterized protein Dsimw501_GD28032, isoform A [Drosophila simulans]|nr:uncharacterized protein Dsimw501_GD28032, isoform A [Drosophila simulans]